MKRKNRPKTGRIHIHIYRGMIDSITHRNLPGPIELVIHDDDVLTADHIPGREISIYQLGKKSKRK